jgi:hypothetical protein
LELRNNKKKKQLEDFDDLWHIYLFLLKENIINSFNNSLFNIYVKSKLKLKLMLMVKNKNKIKIEISKKDRLVK